MSAESTDATIEHLECTRCGWFGGSEGAVTEGKGESKKEMGGSNEQLDRQKGCDFTTVQSPRPAPISFPGYLLI